MESEEEYSSNHKYRGIAVIICNDIFQHDAPRKGAKHDYEVLIDTFKKLGFLVQDHYNLTATDMLLALRKASESEVNKDADCFVCVISTHGEVEDVRLKSDKRGTWRVREEWVCGTDNLVRLDLLLADLKSNACPALNNKPKLIFLQSCRGIKTSEVVEVKPGSNAPPDVNQNKDSADYGDPGMEVGEAGASRACPSVADGTDSGLLSADKQAPDNLADDADDTKLSDSMASLNLHADCKANQPSITEEIVSDAGDGMTPTRPRKKAEKFTLYRIPIEKHFMLAWATQPGFVAFHRSAGKEPGSWFIMSLCKMLLKHHNSLDLLSLMTKVNYHMATKYTASTSSDPDLARKKAMPWIAHQLTKDFYLKDKTPPDA